MTFGSMTLTYHLANLAVVLFMFFKVSTFLESISAGRAWPHKLADHVRVSRPARRAHRAGEAKPAPLGTRADAMDRSMDRSMERSMVGVIDGKIDG